MMMVLTESRLVACVGGFVRSGRREAASSSLFSWWDYDYCGGGRHGYGVVGISIFLLLGLQKVTPHHAYHVNCIGSLSRERSRHFVQVRASSFLLLLSSLFVLARYKLFRHEHPAPA